MKIAAAQLSLTLGNTEANTDKLIKQLELAQSQSIDVLVFPEMSDTGYDASVIINLAQRWDNGTIPKLCKAAKAYNLNVIAGVSERTDNGIYNIENQVFIVACNRVGTDAANVFCGTTIIIDPYGTPVAAGSPIHEGLIVGNIDTEMIDVVRSQIKVHEDRRPTLYSY